MSPEDTSTACWKAEFPAHRDDIADLSVALENLLYPAPLAVSAFEDKSEEQWRVEILLENEPDPEEVARLVPKIAATDIKISKIASENWVEKSLENLKPIRAGRFYVYGSHNEMTQHPGDVPLLIDAGQAFGTGHHATTKGCLIGIENILKKRSISNALDLGCGTGILAVGLAKTSNARILASDIDPIAIEVAKEVASSNECHPRIQFSVGPGTDTPSVQAHAPYDLIVANILAKPLIRMARHIEPLLATNGSLILSGLLASQERAVFSAYNGLCFHISERVPLEEWMTLVLER